ncbi:hypothetical protein [Phyllobacterium bourgognense]|uniref:hypothetical protein n=1 Tax=Phyllobacterium bourgognense TaxID=314236 RepID=UPI001AECA890|nr:hypothetical protein [Phyllobacterium bourgognense]
MRSAHPFENLPHTHAIEALVAGIEARDLAIVDATDNTAFKFLFHNGNIACHDPGQGDISHDPANMVIVADLDQNQIDTAWFARRRKTVRIAADIVVLSGP